MLHGRSAATAAAAAAATTAAAAAAATAAAAAASTATAPTATATASSGSGFRGALGLLDRAALGLAGTATAATATTSTTSSAFGGFLRALSLLNRATLGLELGIALALSRRARFRSSLVGHCSSSAWTRADARSQQRAQKEGELIHVVFLKAFVVKCERFRKVFAAVLS